MRRANGRFRWIYLPPLIHLTVCLVAMLGYIVPALRFLGIFWSILAIADCPASIVTGILAFTQHGALAGAWATVAGTLWWYILCLTAEFLTARIKGERPGSPQ